jgi:hypothetical protein
MGSLLLLLLLSLFCDDGGHDSLQQDGESGIEVVRLPWTSICIYVSTESEAHLCDLNFVIVSLGPPSLKQKKEAI